MPFQRGESRPDGAGRRKGTPNKRTVAVYEAVTKTFHQLGGVRFLVECARKHPTEFIKVWMKLLPLTIKADLKARAAEPKFDVFKRIEELNAEFRAEAARKQAP